MVAVTEALKQAAGDGRCLVTECSEAGCNVPLTGMPKQRVVMSLEHNAAPIDQSKPHCDYLVAYQETNSAADCLVALELKGTVRTTKVVEQLQAGAAIAERLLGQTPAVKFTPVVAGKAHPYEYTELKRKRSFIRFRNSKKPIPIRLIGCGDPLTKALGRR